MPLCNWFGTPDGHRDVLSGVFNWGAVEGQIAGPGGGAWDIGLCNRVSAALNRRIRERAAGKLGAMAALPGATGAMAGGRNPAALEPGRRPRRLSAAMTLPLAAGRGQPKAH